jgi:hypothetical protein
MEKLPNEVLSHIFQFDPTYRYVYSRYVMTELLRTSFKREIGQYGEMLWSKTIGMRVFQRLTSEALKTYKTRNKKHWSSVQLKFNLKK